MTEVEIVEGDLGDIDSCGAVLAAFTSPDEETARKPRTPTPADTTRSRAVLRLFGLSRMALEDRVAHVEDELASLRSALEALRSELQA